ncbi:MAG: hypothetical protein AAF757_06135 [Cyanobacteria bacterium P01_D01_bin.116]
MVERLWTKVTIWSYVPVGIGVGVPDTVQTWHCVELTTDDPECDESVEIIKSRVSKEELIPYVEKLAELLDLEIDLNLPKPPGRR